MFMEDWDVETDKDGKLLYRVGTGYNLQIMRLTPEQARRLAQTGGKVVQVLPRKDGGKWKPRIGGWRIEFVIRVARGWPTFVFVGQNWSGKDTSYGVLNAGAITESGEGGRNLVTLDNKIYKKEKKKQKQWFLDNL